MQQGTAKNTSAKPKRTAITPRRDENFPEWYQNVVKAADLAENSPVRGCMTIKPYGFAIWENIQRIFDKRIKQEDVENAYFPLLIPLSFIAEEAEHIDGFATECAVVTHHRLEADENGSLVPAGKLAEPYVIRPTSETIIGEAFSRWIQSYRDLPLKINQWANVMRWEMRPRLFLRTSEFLWQEGHNAFETAEQANADALHMLDVYVDFVENILAMPVIPGPKTADERFPGAKETYTFEAVMQDGKALQAGTSHDLGQTFSKSCNITFQSREGQEEHAYTTSWGISTRLIGGMIMMHGDDDGMIMPPRIAPYHVIIIPITKKNQDSTELLDYCAKLKKELLANDIRVKLDDSENKTPDKLWGSIKKGVPVRVEIGGREMENGELTFTRRDIGRDSKTTVSFETFNQDISSVLDSIHDNMFKIAKERMRSQIHIVDGIDDVREFFAADKAGLVKTGVEILDDPAYEELKKELSISSRCIPFEDDGQMVLIGKSY